MERIVYQNKWCKIVNKDTIYILRSKSGKYNDQYFQTLDDAKKAIGVIPPTQKYTFISQ